MSLASQTVFPSGGRLGRRSRTWPRLLISSASAVVFAAILVGLVALVGAALAFVPVVGYLEAAAVPILGARLRRRSPDTHAGLRTLARD